MELTGLEFNSKVESKKSWTCYATN